MVGLVNDRSQPNPRRPLTTPMSTTFNPLPFVLPLLLAGALLLLNGCLEFVAQSPDGRHAVFRNSDTSLQLWDMETDTGKIIYDGEEDLHAVRYFPSGDALLIADSDLEHCRLIKVVLAGGARTVLAEKVPLLSFDLTADGKQLYACVEKAIYRIDVAAPEKRERLRAIGDELRYLRLRPDGKQLLCTAEHRIFLLDTKTGEEVGKAIASPEDESFMGVSWLDDTHFLYYLVDDDETASLYVRDTLGAKSRLVSGRCYFGTAPAADAAKQHVYICHVPAEADIDSVSSYQIVRFNLKTGDRKVVVKEAAINPVLSPDGKRLMYLSLSDNEEDADLIILDLESGMEKVAKQIK